MTPVLDATPPQGSLIADFAAQEGHYTDAFTVAMDRPVTLAQYITVFYSTPLFRAERLVLALLARAPSRPEDLAALADARSDRFAVWTVEARREAEILLGDASGRTKSWLCLTEQAQGCTLWFGSVVVPVLRRGKLVQGPVFDALRGPHQFYSRALLGSAAARLRNNR